MSKFRAILVGLLVIPLAASAIYAGDYETTIDKYSLWLGSHYTGFNDYTKKVGKYNLGNDELLPEFRLTHLSKSPGGMFSLDAHYYDDRNVFGKIRTTSGDKFKATFQYRSLTFQEGQDLLTNIEAREWLPSANKAGGKMLTHEILDGGADYNTRRQQTSSDLDMRISKKNNVRLKVSHRLTLKSGTEQKISSNHCFSCHLTSQTAEVKQKQHQLTTSLSGEFKEFNIGYRFGYRSFESDAGYTTAFYDEARHPVNGGSAPEFGSRVIYDNETLEFSRYPKTEKISHKVRVKGDIGEGTLAGSVVYSKTENKYTQLVNAAWAGAGSYAYPINDKTRLIAKMSGTTISADDPFIDLPTHREGAADGNETDFDYVRYSSLDRMEFKLSAELITKLNPKTTLAVLGGYDLTDRDDYPAREAGIQTKKLMGQVKLRYRQGLRLNNRIKYRFEKISDPFVSGRGLLEEVGHGNDILSPQVPTSNWVFYFQREDLRYQDITTSPTQVHKFEWRTTYSPGGKYSANVGFNGKLDKNSELGELDVKHVSYQPNAFVNYVLDQKWAMTAGYTYSYDKSRLPVAVALFDG